MLRVCSNGVLFQSLLKHLQYSTISPANGRSPSSMVDFMVKSLGFSQQEAETAWSKVSSSDLIGSKQNPNLVVDFLKQRGLDKTQIKKLISCRPHILKCNVDKTLVPKFDAFQELGIFGSELIQIIASNASILRRGLATRIAPMINFLRSNVGSDERFLRILRSDWLMSVDASTRLQPNIDLLRKYGLSDKKVFHIMRHKANIFRHDPDKFEELIVKVNKELQVPFDSPSFSDAIVLVAAFGDKNREAKCMIFKSYGWTDMDILIMIRKLPKLLYLSESSICKRLEFFVNELGLEPEYLAKCPYAMTFSMEERILPRYALIRGLKERRIISPKVNILTSFHLSKAMFFQKFVRPYKDEVPELCEAYACGVKGIRVS